MIKKINWPEAILGLFIIAFFFLPFFGIEKNVISFFVFIGGLIYGIAFIYKAIKKEKEKY